MIDAGLAAAVDAAEAVPVGEAPRVEAAGVPATVPVGEAPRVEVAAPAVDAVGGAAAVPLPLAEIVNMGEYANVGGFPALAL